MAVTTGWSADWDLLFSSLNEELEYEITDIEGTLPAGLRGSWFRTGTSSFERGGTQIATVDSDGMVVRVSFDGGRAFFKNRCVRTEGYVKEVAAGKVLFKGVFGTLPTEEEHLRGTRLKRIDPKAAKNVSNTNLLLLPKLGRMLSMWEGGLPYSVDPDTLETIGVETFGGLLGPEAIFSAHPCLEASTQRLVNFGVIPGSSPRLRLWELDVSGDEARLVQEHRLTLSSQAIIHDICITPRWAVLIHNPVAFDLRAAMTKGASVDDLLTREFGANAVTRIYVFPRDPALLGGSADAINELCAEYVFENGFTYHHANAFEDSDGSIVVDSVVYGQKPDLDMRNVRSRIELNTLCGKGRLMRYRMPAPTAAGAVPGLGRPELLPGSPLCCEMPVARGAFQGQKRRFLYSVDVFCDEGEVRPWAALLKSDVETGARTEWRAPARCYIGEPTFAPAGTAEDDGWLLLIMFDATRRRSALLVLDAKDIAAGPVCSLWLKHHIPSSFHTMWSEQAFGLLRASRL